MRILKVAATEFMADRVPRLAAALSYYTLLALAPMVLILVGTLSLVYGNETARAALVQQMGDLVGPSGAQLMDDVLRNAHAAPITGVASLFGGILLLVGATGVGAQIQDALNTIWGVKAAKHGWLRKLIQKRLLSLAFLAALGFLLLVSLSLSAGVAAVTSAYGATLGAWVAVANAAGMFLSVTVLLAVAYRVLPDCRVRWQDVWLGAIVASLLFAAGRFALGAYLGNASVATAFGAAGSLAVFMVWVYYSGLIFFVGAELTQAQAAVAGVPLVPERGATVTRAGEAPAAAARPRVVEEASGGLEAPHTQGGGLLLGALATGLGIGLLGRGLRRKKA